MAVVVDDFAGDRSTTGVLTPFAPVSGALEMADDVDWFAVEMEAGETYRIRLRGDGGDMHAWAYNGLRLYSPGYGSYTSYSYSPIFALRYSEPSGTPELFPTYWGSYSYSYVRTEAVYLKFTAQTDATFFVGVNGDGYEAFDYLLDMQVLEDDLDLPDDWTTPAFLERGESLSSVLGDPDDIDAIRLDLAPGELFTVKFTGDGDIPNRNGGWSWGVLYYSRDSYQYSRYFSLDDSSIERDGERMVIATGRVSEAVDAENPYVILKVQSWEPGGYRVELFEDDDPEPNQPRWTGPDTPAAEADGDDYLGAFQYPGDFDFVRVEGAPGSAYRVTITGDGETPAQIDYINFYSIYRNTYSYSGYTYGYTYTNWLGAWDNWGYSGYGYSPEYPVLTLAPARTDGELVLGLLGDSGGYRVSVEALTDDFAQDASTTGALPANGPWVEGEIEYTRDQDWFAVDVEAGHTYLVRLVAADGQVLPFGRDVSSYRGHDSLALYDAYGNWMAFDTSLIRDIDTYRSYSYWGSYTYTFTYTYVSGVETVVMSFFTPVDGELFVSVGEDSRRAPLFGYQVLLEDLGELDDAPAGPGGPLLGDGDEISEGIQFPGDIDWFALDVLPDTAYLVEVYGDGPDPIDAGALDLSLVQRVVYSTYSTYYGGTAYSSYDNFDRLDLTPAGTYGGLPRFVAPFDFSYAPQNPYLEVRAGEGVQGGYHVKLVSVFDPDPASFYLPAEDYRTLTDLLPLDASIGYEGDRDVFLLDAEGPGEVYRLRVHAEAGDGPRLWDALGRDTYVSYSSYSGYTTYSTRFETDWLNYTTYYHPENGDRVYLIFGAGEHAHDLVRFSDAGPGDYELSLDRLSDPEPNYYWHTDAAFPVLGEGDHYSGAIDYQWDRDVFELEVEAGTRYRLQIAGDGLGEDAWFRLRSGELYVYSTYSSYYSFSSLYDAYSSYTADGIVVTFTAVAADVHRLELNGEGPVDYEISLAEATDPNTPPDARDDDFAVAATSGTISRNVLADNGSGADSDPDGDAIRVAAVEGQAGLVGTSFDLAGGGRARINADGSFWFNPDGDFADLAAGASRVAVLSYTLADAHGA
ncbi:MAG: Ig-like domain-containing protein, partial [Pseudomonadota bacterium]|nr:Ig-like domain-containing protein [Pseudomonadota bacterium]